MPSAALTRIDAPIPKRRRRADGQNVRRGGGDPKPRRAGPPAGSRQRSHQGDAYRHNPPLLPPPPSIPRPGPFVLHLRPLAPVPTPPFPSPGIATPRQRQHHARRSGFASLRRNPRGNLIADHSSLPDLVPSPARSASAPVCQHQPGTSKRHTTVPPSPIVPASPQTEIVPPDHALDEPATALSPAPSRSRPPPSPTASRDPRGPTTDTPRPFAQTSAQT